MRTITDNITGKMPVLQEGKAMKITDIECIPVQAPGRTLVPVLVHTDAGITGYGECSDGRNPYGVVATVVVPRHRGEVRRLAPVLLVWIDLAGAAEALSYRGGVPTLPAAKGRNRHLPVRFGRVFTPDRLSTTSQRHGFTAGLHPDRPCPSVAKAWRKGRLAGS